MILMSSLIPDKSKTGMDVWSPLALMPQLITIFLSTFLIMIVAISYNKKLKQKDQLYEPRGIVLLAEMLINVIENMVIEILGVKYKRLTVYCLYLLIYVIVGNLFQVLGFDSQASSYTVVLAMGLVAFIGIYYFGLKYQKISFFKKYLFNPLELISQFVPLISMTFRLFGNVLGGSIIISLLYEFLGFIWSHVPVIGPVDMLSMIIAPWAHIYFDIFDGSIQAYIFCILTLIYWQSEMNHTSKKQKNEELDIRSRSTRKKIKNEEKIIKNNKKIINN